MLASDLIDELRLQVYPVLLASGKCSFGDGSQASSFRLEASKASSSGVLTNRCIRKDEGRTGSFETD